MDYLHDLFNIKPFSIMGIEPKTSLRISHFFYKNYFNSFDHWGYLKFCFGLTKLKLQYFIFPVFKSHFWFETSNRSFNKLLKKKLPFDNNLTRYSRLFPSSTSLYFSLKIMLIINKLTEKKWYSNYFTIRMAWMTCTLIVLSISYSYYRHFFLIFFFFVLSISSLFYST